MRKKPVTVISVVLMLALLLMTLGGCGGKNAAPEPVEPVSGNEPAGQTEQVSDNEPAAPTESDEPAEPEAPAGRQDGERFEDVIIMEGMEETVRYEHIINDALGFEMDYDYELFSRRSEADRECFISIYDDAENPENYLEVTYSEEDADSAAESVRETLSQEYELLEGTRELENSGSCLRIEASVIKGTNNMADQLQAVYIIPAGDGCRIATAHYAVEAAEGFGRRFNYMINTLTVIDRNGERKLSDEQALSAVESYCYSMNPDLEGIVKDGKYPVYWEVASSDDNEIVVLFRSYTGAQIRYYIDRATGEAYSTEFVPGITTVEERSGESLNVWEYAG